MTLPSGALLFRAGALARPGEDAIELLIHRIDLVLERSESASSRPMRISTEPLPSIVIRASARAPAATGSVGSAGVFGSVADFGKALFTVDLLPFEVTALVLMVAVIGVITLGGEQMSDAEAQQSKVRADRAVREAILREGKG